MSNQNGGTDPITFNAVNARYVRMQGVERALPYGYSLWEMAVYGEGNGSGGSGSGGSTNGANVAVNKTVTASGSENDAMAAANAVDGNSGTRWSSNFADDAWMTVDLGQTYSINRVMILWEAAYGKAYKIQVSTNGNDWTTVANLTNQDGGTDPVTFNSVNARYVRMQGVERALPYGYSIWEFGVYGE